jgi:hypothetical protein
VPVSVEAGIDLAGHCVIRFQFSVIRDPSSIEPPSHRAAEPVSPADHPIPLISRT